MGVIEPRYTIINGIRYREVEETRIETPVQTRDSRGRMIDSGETIRYIAVRAIPVGLAISPEPSK